ncbi:carbon-nitrogen hydrolase family protein [Bacteriovoracaceae bacterium]|nr:carbon-nitrogen hydrolase family protein [Bacteriovoracaceae bacterium]
MIKIGITQIRNSTDVEKNFISIMNSLKLFEQTDTDLILFPECSLSGFSAKMKDCTMDLLSDYLVEIESWSRKHNKYVILPTALVDEKIYNTGFIFGGIETERFYKTGLTESEKKFFSIPEQPTKKVFRIKDHNVAILICFEAEMEAFSFFNKGEADLILWPGYWGWEKDDKWEDLKKDGDSNLIFQNMKKWEIPLLQSNFAYNDLAEHRDAGPHGLSMFVNKDNSLFSQAEIDKESCYQITIETQQIKNCKRLGDL